MLRKYSVTALVLAGVLGVLILATQQSSAQPPAGLYTAAQANAGRAAYQANCASCHARRPERNGKRLSAVGRPVHRQLGRQIAQRSGLGLWKAPCLPEIQAAWVSRPI